LLGVTNPQLDPISRTSISSPEPRPADLSLSCAMLQTEFPDLVPNPIQRAHLSP